MHIKPKIIWLTGLSGAGKSTIAEALNSLLKGRGDHTFVLDGDALRQGLNRDLGFEETDRKENVRRVSEVAKLMADAGLTVIVAVISPYRAGREAAKFLVGPGEFLEIFVDTPIEECMRRDPRGLYKKAISGEIAAFTGIHSPYEPPLQPDLRLQTLDKSPLDLARKIVSIMFPGNTVAEPATTGEDDGACL